MPERSPRSQIKPELKRTAAFGLWYARSRHTLRTLLPEVRNVECRKGANWSVSCCVAVVAIWMRA
jgi:hypothetical protein